MYWFYLFWRHAFLPLTKIIALQKLLIFEFKYFCEFPTFLKWVKDCQNNNSLNWVFNTQGFIILLYFSVGMNISVIKREKHKTQNKTTLVKINLCSFVCISSSAWQLATDGDTYLTSCGGKDWWHTGPPPPSQVLPDGLRKFPFIFYFLSYTI